MRRKELSGSSLFIALQSTSLRFFLLCIILSVGNIELIQPSHNFYILAVIIGHTIANVCNETLVGKQVVRQKHFCIVTDVLEKERHIIAILIADSNQKATIKNCFLWVVIYLHTQIFVYVASHSFLKNLRTHLTSARGYHFKISITIGIHIAESHNTVEPCVCHLFYDKFLSFRGNSTFEFSNLGLKSTEFCCVLSQDEVHLCANQRNEFLSGFLRESFQRSSICCHIVNMGFSST